MGARETVSLLKRETPAFISPDLWPPNSPDLGRNAATYLPDKSPECERLEESLINVWADMQQSVIDDAIDQWRKRLHACVRARGGHFEHAL